MISDLRIPSELGIRARRRRPPAAGVVLLEALVAGTILAVGLIALARWQLELRADGDLAARRSTAVRLAVSELETLRGWAAGAASNAADAFSGIVDETRDLPASGRSNRPSAWRIDRRIDTTMVVDTKEASVDIGWDDAAGRPQHVVLRSILGRRDATLATVGTGADTWPAAGLRQRAASIPVDATDLGDGTSAFALSSAGLMAFVLDNADGRVVAACDRIAPDLPTERLSSRTLGTCRRIAALLLGGTVRFSSAAAPSLVDANDSPPAFALELWLSGGGYFAAPSCGVRAMKGVSYRRAGSAHRTSVPAESTPLDLGVPAWTETGEHFARYDCVVPVRDDGRWSGRLRLRPTGWMLGHGAANRRVCRVVADLDGDPAHETNAEHPAVYAAVDGPLTNQNLLVVRGDRACPKPDAVELQPG